MIRIPHILKPIKTCNHPSNLLFFDTETRPYLKESTDELKRNKLWFGYSLAYRLDNHKRSRINDLFFDSTDLFWLFVESRMDKKRPLYCYCHNAAFDLTIVDFWRHSERMNWDIQFAVLESPPVIITCKTDIGMIHFIDTTNYFKVSLKVLGESIGLEKLEIDFEKTTKEDAKVYCKRDVDIIATAIDNLFDFVRANKLGKVGSTIASLAFSAYRHRFMSHDIYIHDRERVLKLEKGSYHGGMVDCKFVGKVEGKTITKLDVNSLYPTVMQGLFPVKLRYSMPHPGIKHTEKELRTMGVIADVTIDTDDETYPIVQNKELIFAVGRFKTILCGPELRRAFDRGHVKHIHYAAYYDMAEIFKEYVMFFWDLRHKYQDQKDKAGSTLCKYLMNSLYGKFAQGIYEWVPLTVNNTRDIVTNMEEHFPSYYDDPNNLPVVDQGQRYWVPMDTNATLKVRRISTLTQIQRKVGYHHESFIAIAAYVTSYARCYLKELMEIAGESNVYYYDTDSLFVNERGYSKLIRANRINHECLGGLKIEGREHNPIFLAPKDYMFGEQLCLKGVRHKATEICRHNKPYDACKLCRGHTKEERYMHGEFEQLQFEGLRGVINRGFEPYIDIVTIRKKISHRYKKGMVGSDGWTRPFRLPDDFPA